MKKFARIARTLFYLFVLTSSSSAFAFFSSYIGTNAGIINGNAVVNSITSKRSTGSLLGLSLGIEVQTPLLVKIGLEALAQKVYLFNSSSSALNYRNPAFFGVKGKLMLNLIVMEPYLVLGYGREVAMKLPGNIKNYDTNYFSIGLGSQVKIYDFALFAEANYQQSLRPNNGLKTRYVTLQLGLKYYFL